MILPISDVSTRALQAALKGLDERQRDIADNVANVETPGFRAGVVNFEDSLRTALAEGSDVSDATATVTSSQAPTRLNGNNVNLDMEMVAQSESLLRTQLVVAALNSKYSMLRTAISGQ